MFKRIITTGLSLSLFLAAGVSMASDGAAVYKRSCKMCHSSGMMGAPKTGNKATWAPLIAKGVDTLVASTRAGVGKMRPRGGCKACSDDDLAAAVHHMVDMSK